MGIILLIILSISLIQFLWVCLDASFDQLYDFIDGAILATDEEDLKDYMDNPEYDWGHNIKNYMEEEL